MSEGAVSPQTSEATFTLGRLEFPHPMLPFGRLFGQSPIVLIRAETNLEAWVPAVDVQLCNGTLVVWAELPGLKREDVKVEVNDGVLAIKGERKREHKEDHEGYHRWERSYGRFYWSIRLPKGAKTDQLRAEMKDGVLKVTVPVPETIKNSRHVSVAA